jgi:hypothetical protein
VDVPLNEAIPENHLRARLDEVDRSVAVERHRGLEALRPLWLDCSRKTID